MPIVTLTEALDKLDQLRERIRKGSYDMLDRHIEAIRRDCAAVWVDLVTKQEAVS